MEFEHPADPQTFHRLDGFSHFAPHDDHHHSNGQHFQGMDVDLFSEPVSATSSLHDNNFSFDPRMPIFQDQQHQQFQNIDPRSVGLESDANPSHVRKNGLYTPPFAEEDEFSGAVLDNAKDLVDSAASTVQSKLPASPPSKETSKKTKQGSTVSTNQPHSSGRPRATKKSMSTRKARKGYKATTKEEENDPEGEEKRQKFLERNRVAASKCRDKKKAWTEIQEGKLRGLQANNKLLRQQCVELQRDLVILKEAALPHFDCSPEIRQYLVGSVGQQQQLLQQQQQQQPAGNGDDPFGMTDSPHSDSSMQDMDEAAFAQSDLDSFFALPPQSAAAAAAAIRSSVSDSSTSSVRSVTPSLSSSNIGSSIDPQLSEGDQQQQQQSSDLKTLIEAELIRSQPGTPRVNRR